MALFVFLPEPQGQGSLRPTLGVLRTKGNISALGCAPASCSNWKDHLAAMDHLRQGIHLRGYAQKNPKQEYKRESFELFSSMLENIKHDVVSILTIFSVSIKIFFN